MTASITLHLPILKFLVEASKIKTVIEIGCGLSTTRFIKSLKKHGGILYSIDIRTYDAFMEKSPYWIFLHGDSLTIDLKKLPEKCDMLFIDSKHTYIQLKAELKKFEPLVRNGGYIVMHDINETSNIEMFPAFREFVRNHPTYTLFWIQFSQGLAILKKNE